ncbi:hypothetical protein PaecuDRAFT_1801 [Paenibacillus curdlanolyticus YK9]|uniref:Uncharacterized protein n=1 Tax=Paenibacillus curdlanolyticus YK9 TaxID=717606 RepID=E0I850_9BACL|nr:hypothetical protein [Paenibacillus curdlanolyticus]EFM11355.1 hypothetical protein PaecuDRAFT_1801 [Paenibacillus curdlanolyticus YK9]
MLGRIKYMQALYVIGIALIIAHGIWSMAHLTAPYASLTQGSAAAPSSDTMTSLIIKPIVTSPVNRIIFRCLFYLFVWVMLFLVVPVAFLRLKRFKFFNVEFEVEGERAAIQRAIITTSKASLMEYLTGRDAFIKTLGCMHGNVITFTDVLRVLLDDIQTAYRDTFDAGFTIEVYEDEVPPKYLRMAQHSKETGQSALWNKPENGHPFQTNKMVYYYPLSDTSFILTALSSYATQFDAFDKHVLPLLHNVISKNIESIELMVVATNPQNSQNPPNPPNPPDARGGTR